MYSKRSFDYLVSTFDWNLKNISPRKASSTEAPKHGFITDGVEKIIYGYWNEEFSWDNKKSIVLIEFIFPKAISDSTYLFSKFYDIEVLYNYVVFIRVKCQTNYNHLYINLPFRLFWLEHYISVWRRQNARLANQIISLVLFLWVLNTTSAMALLVVVSFPSVWLGSCWSVFGFLSSVLCT